MINTRSVAVEGIGFGARAVATEGFILSVAVTETVAQQSFASPAARHGGSVSSSKKRNKTLWDVTIIAKSLDGMIRGSVVKQINDDKYITVQARLHDYDLRETLINKITVYGQLLNSVVIKESPLIVSAYKLPKKTS